MSKKDQEPQEEQDKGMKIHLDISMDDIFTYDEDVESAIKKRIIRESVDAIWKKVKDKVEKTVNAKAIALVESKMDSMIYDEIMALIKEDRIKGRYGDETSLQDFVESKFNGNNKRGERAVEDVVTDLANKFGKEMKDRYDMLFASQLIIKLRDQGMLAEEYAKTIGKVVEKDDK